MKNHKLPLGILSLLLFGVIPGVTQETSTTPTAVDKVLELYGVTEEVEQLPGILLASLDQQQAQLGPEVYRALRNAFEFAFTSGKLYKSLATSFTEQANQVDDQQLSRTLTWLRTPLARKMIALESAANTLEAREAIEQYGVTLESQPPPQPRKDLVWRLDETRGSTRLALDFQAVVLRALLKGANSLLPEEKQTTGSQIDLQIIDMKLQLLGLIREQVQVSMLYTYREVSDEELAEYLSYWETDDGFWLARTTSQALLDAMSAASHEAGVLIGLQGVDVAPQE